KLYYWDAPFRGNFIRLLLSEANLSYEEADPTKIYPKKREAIKFPAMAPPILYDKEEKSHLSQMPAIVMYLAEKHDLAPKDFFLKAIAAKLIMDCNDVLMEITNFNGQKMWKQDEWRDFRNNRLSLWMRIFEKTGSSHGLKENSGFILGKRASAADIAAAALFGTMVYCFPQLKQDLEEQAPKVASLCARIERRKNISKFLTKQRKEYGTIYCGGQIEKSIRRMLNA
ncbi:MAG: glutathione S-transferase family protein, partial [Bacteriovoracaceae bacterium]